MLHHIELYVSNLNQSRTFYDFLLPRLDYELYQDWEQGFSYKKVMAISSLCKQRIRF